MTLNFEQAGAQDDCLLAMGDGHQLNEAILRRLPPWRAVMIARAARRANCYTAARLEKLEADARRIGGDGTLPGAS